MDIRDSSQPDDASPDRTGPVAHGDRASVPGRPAEDALYLVLRRLVDDLPPLADPMAGVLKRVGRIRLRRRIVRAVASTTVLVTAGMFGPTLAGQIQDWHHPDEVAAAPPAAVLDLTVAYPESEAPSDQVLSTTSGPASVPPVNALDWPARGDELPPAALDLARSYLLAETKAAGSAVVADDAVANQLWAQQEPDKQVWTYAVEGWTVGPKGAAAAQIIVGEYAPGGVVPSPKGTTTPHTAVPEMTAYSTPVRFTHPTAGTSPDPDAAARIAEYSVWLPLSNRLLVLGAPQVKSVLYAKDGKKFVAQPTQDGVALFPRAKAPSHGSLADLVQVRDARNQALTPPVGWTAPDLSLSGAGAFYVTNIGWSGLKGSLPATSAVPATPVPVPSGTPIRPTPSAPVGTQNPPAPPKSGTVTASSGAPPSGPTTGPVPPPATDPSGGPATSPGDPATALPPSSGASSANPTPDPTGWSGLGTW
jgi:hypothetical protein